MSEPRRRLGSVLVIVVVLVVVGALAGAVSAAVRGTTFTSESQLSWDPSVRAQLDPNYATPDSTTFDREVADQNDVILSDSVVDKVATRLGETPQQVRDSITVTTTAGSSVFNIGASATSASEAQRIASEVTDTYVATLLADNTATLQQRVGALTPVITALRKQLATTTAAAAGPLATNIADLQSQSAAYTVALADVPVEATVLREAQAPTAPASLSLAVTTAIGAALGLVIAVCIVLLLNSLPSRRRLPFLPQRALQRPAAPAAVDDAAAPAPQAAPAAEQAAVVAEAEHEPALERSSDEKDDGYFASSSPRSLG